MKYRVFIGIIVLALIPLVSNSQIPEPEKFFGFKPGADYQLINYEKLVDYLNLVDKSSDMVRMVEIGISPMGKPIYSLFISSEENIKNLDKLGEINKKLALDYTLSDLEQAELVKTGKVFALVTLSMHSSEVGPTQALPLIVNQLITDKSETTRKILNDVVYMAVPCHNPDGMNMVVDYFYKTKGTKYEGSSYPGLYHKYIGHDNNRDFVTLTQSDTKAISSLTSTVWFPQVMVEKHQMGYTGSRYYVPPFYDPIAENIEPELYAWTSIFGHNMLNDLTAQGFLGISQNNAFDNYWPGSTETCIWKNVISFLTEAASVKLAKPIYIEPTELSGGGKGLPENKKAINNLAPWNGGWWRLSDIVDLEVASTMSMLNTAYLYKDKILKYRNDVCKQQVEKGKSQAPYYFIIPQNQTDLSELVSIVELLKEHGVWVCKLKSNITLNNYNYNVGDIVVPLAQPFRMFVKEVLEVQKYPERKIVAGGDIITPYDITTWSLPLHRGLTCHQIDTRYPELEKEIEQINYKYSLANTTSNSKYAILSSSNNQSYQIVFELLGKGNTVERALEDVNINGGSIPAGSFVVENSNKTKEVLSKAIFPTHNIESTSNLKLSAVKLPRIALIDSPIQSTDAGWTRFVLDSYGVKYSILTPAEFENLDVKTKFDVIILPNTSASILKEGKQKRNNLLIPSDYPTEYTKGMGSKGVENIIKFINDGGIAISWEASTELFEGTLSINQPNSKEEFVLPFRNVGDAIEKLGVKCPGSLIRIKLNNESPITWGLGKEIGIFYRGKPAFTTQIPNLDMDRRIIGYFGDDNLLISGYLKGEEFLAKKSAIVWIQKGKGQIVLMGFSPTFRASVPATYKILFNSILLENK
ncbi:MAG TPA: M14 family metallopeptidase [Tenuifilaceae bacterium]|nr:M14 family metallopeptidase [Tenuifilaceae bacterium]HPI45840.1 M14 family metallopeptidase [Tenuifilaceae bacterium]HPN21170.1 M14 family metallopeptidase [Tenuifilaceae bacterium]